jgi:hypothetical protein
VAVEIEPPAVDDGGNVQLRFDVKHLAVPAQARKPDRPFGYLEYPMRTRCLAYAYICISINLSIVISMYSYVDVDRGICITQKIDACVLI